ncbi:MAG: hypothetical protein AB1725_11490 [Armatimonadota bacterium]
MKTKLKMSTLLMLLACALAATTSLTPVVATATAGRAADAEACAELMGQVGARIVAYRQSHDGRMPERLGDIGMGDDPARLSVKCPIHGDLMRYVPASWFAPGAISPSKAAEYKAMVNAINWDDRPVLVCLHHYDPASVDGAYTGPDGRVFPYVSYDQRQQRYTGNGPVRHLCVDGRGRVRYLSSEDDPEIARLSEWLRVNLGGQR